MKYPVLVLLVIALLLSCVGVARAQDNQPLPINPDGKPDPGIPWGGTWTITKIYNNSTFQITWDGHPGGYSNSIVKVGCLDGDTKDPPKLDDKYIRVGNQKWDPAKGNTQTVGWIETEENEFGANLPFATMAIIPPPCTLCQLCFEKGKVENNKWTVIQNYGCVNFERAPSEPMLGILMMISAGQEVKVKIDCKDGKIPEGLTAWVERFNANTEKWVHHLSLDFADGSIKVNCGMLDTTSEFKIMGSYYDQGTLCIAGGYIKDPVAVLIALKYFEWNK